MKNLCLIVLLLLSTLAVAGGKHVLIPEPIPVVSVSPNPLPSEVLDFHGIIDFSPATGYTTAEKQKLVMAEAQLNVIIHSACFEQFMLKRGLIQTNGRTPAQVVAHLRSLHGTVPVEMYSAWLSRVVGFTSPTDPVIHTNRKFYAGATSLAWASNLGHEGAGHKLGGYDHDFKATTRRPYSVPYSINAAIEKCGEE